MSEEISKISNSYSYKANNFAYNLKLKIVDDMQICDI